MGGITLPGVLIGIAGTILMLMAWPRLTRWLIQSVMLALKSGKKNYGDMLARWKRELSKIDRGAAPPAAKKLQRKPMSENDRKVVTVALVVAGIVLGGMMLTAEIGQTLRSPTGQETLLNMQLLSKFDSASYEVECDFDEINAFLTGHFEEIPEEEIYDEDCTVATVTRRSGRNWTKNGELFSSESRFNTTEESTCIPKKRNITGTNYVPERFDLNGLKGIRCRLSGGVNQ